MCPNAVIETSLEAIEKVRDYEVDEKNKNVILSEAGMSKICTSQEQSKKLVELGIDVNTADMYYDCNSYGIQGKPEVAIGTVWSKDIPAWSLAALLKLIPKFSLEKDISKNAEYQLHYNYNTVYYDEPVDAAFEMICWLKKYDKL